MTRCAMSIAVSLLFCAMGFSAEQTKALRLPAGVQSPSPIAAKTAPAETEPRDSRFSLPEKKGALQIALGGLRVRKSMLAPDGSYLEVSASRGPIMARIFLKSTLKAATATACRDVMWQEEQKTFDKMGAKLESVALSSGGPMAVVEYRLPSYQDKPLNLKAVRAYLAGGDLCAEVHLAANDGPENVAPMKAILSSTRMLPDYSPGTIDDMRFGNVAYRAQEYKQAAAYYQHALDASGSDKELGPILWRIMIDQLGISYSLTGELARSKQVLEFGISRDPHYPMFYYNLACADAQSDDLSGTLFNLAKAFDNRRNIIPGELMPDPRKDESFQKFASNERFQELVRSLKLD